MDWRILSNYYFFNCEFREGTMVIFFVVIVVLGVYLGMFVCLLIEKMDINISVCFYRLGLVKLGFFSWVILILISRGYI